MRQQFSKFHRRLLNSFIDFSHVNHLWAFCLSFFLFLLFYRFELRGLLSLWNTMLAMFSIMGAFRTAPELIHVLRNYGLFHSVCVPRWVYLVSCVITWTGKQSGSETIAHEAFSLDKKLFLLESSCRMRPKNRLLCDELCNARAFLLT